MNILGLSCHYHDAAACVLTDGRVIAAAEEERFTRRKHDPGFPSQAIDFVLTSAGLAVSDLDHVVFYEKPLLKFERILSFGAQKYPTGLDHFVSAMHAWLGEKLWIPSRIRGSTGFRGLILYGAHHLSHAASAFYASPFEEAAVLTMDGLGEWASTTIAHGRGLDLEILREIHFPHSLGLVYAALTAYLGFEVNDGEYKVMGMAAYGRPRYADALRRVLQLAPDGSYRTDLRFFDYASGRRPWTTELERLLGPACEPPNDSADPDERCADIAASIQLVLEEAVLGLAREARRLTGTRDLCLAGGVALNVLANRRVALETDFERVYVPPAPGDSGGAIGAAAFLQHAVLRLPRESAITSSLLGPSFSDEEIGQFLDQEQIPYRRLSNDELVQCVADQLTSDKVVGWFQGRMEFGPRALGARSVLGNPCNPRMKEILNTKIKHREPFRPFAPSVTREDAGRFFEDAPDSPFMSFIARIRPQVRSLIPAASHVDGTARLQTVSADDNPLYHRLLRTVEQRVGVPMVINTSFNVRGEPIVCTPADAFRSFSHTDMDTLALGHYLIDASAKRRDEPYPGRDRLGERELL